jgi:hypothetical protein
MPHEYPISYLYTLAQKTMAFDFAILSHDYAPLYFHEWTDKRAVADGAAVQVAEVRKRDIHALAPGYVLDHVL